MTASTRWTLIIVGLLGGNLLAMALLIGSSQTSRAQVIPEYYQRAVRFDDEIDDASRARDLGWQIRASLERDAITVEVADRAGKPVVGVVHVHGFQRAHAANRFEVDLAAIADGRYRIARANELGVHDLDVVVERGSSRFVAHVVIEAR